MWYAIGVFSACFIGLMGGVGITLSNTDVKWTDAVSAIGTVIAAIGTVGTLAFAVRQNSLSRRDALIQKLIFDAAELSALLPLLTDLDGEVVRSLQSLHYGGAMQEWYVHTDPAQIANLRKRLEAAHEHASLPVAKGICDRAVKSLDELSAVDSLSKSRLAHSSDVSMRSKLIAAQAISSAELKRATDIHSALISQLAGLGIADPHM